MENGRHADELDSGAEENRFSGVGVQGADEGVWGRSDGWSRRSRGWRSEFWRRPGIDEASPPRSFLGSVGGKTTGSRVFMVQREKLRRGKDGDRQFENFESGREGRPRTLISIWGRGKAADGNSNGLDPILAHQIGLRSIGRSLSTNVGWPKCRFLRSGKGETYHDRG